MVSGLWVVRLADFDMLVFNYSMSDMDQHDLMCALQSASQHRERRLVVLNLPNAELTVVDMFSADVESDKLGELELGLQAALQVVSQHRAKIV